MAQVLNESWQSKYTKEAVYQTLPTPSLFLGFLSATSSSPHQCSTVSPVSDMRRGMTKAKASCLPVFTPIIQNTEFSSIELPYFQK